MTSDVVLAVTYYSPYVSGLTEVVRAEAEGLTKRGFTVTVVTNQHDPDLPSNSMVNGVTVVRCPVQFRLGRGTFAPTFAPTVLRHARQAKALHIHAPMLEAGPIARLARNTTRTVLTHHIDLWVPRTLSSPLAVATANVSTKVAIRNADLTIVNSDDQAHGSRFWPDLDRRPWTAIPAACHDRRGGQARYRQGEGHHFGFLGRIVEDKGLRYLVNAFRQVPDPHARLLIGGDHINVAGGSTMSTLQADITDDPRISTLGLLRGQELDDFYASIDTFMLPSVAESFGIAQAEAIMSGSPSITTDIPGGRYPVAATGLGRLVPPRDSDALAAAMQHPHDLTREEVDSAAAWARTAFGIESFLDQHVASLNLTSTTTTTIAS